MVPNLSRFPSELIGQICRNLCVHCANIDSDAPWSIETYCHGNKVVLADERRNLYNLCLVCRKVRREAQPVLHHLYGFDDNANLSLPLFCRTISTIPHLSQSVQVLHLKSLTVATWSSSDEVRWVRPVVERFKSQLNFWAIPEKPEEDNNFLLKVIPVLTMLQVTRAVQLCTSGLPRLNVFTHLRQRQQGEASQHLLPQLQFLEMKIPNTENILVRPNLPMPISSSHLRGFLVDFTKLQSLSLRHVQNSSVPDNLSLKSVCRLDLQDTTLDKDKLRVLIEATGDLKDFKYGELRGPHSRGMSALDVDNSDNPPVSSRDVVSALTVKRDTLRKLMLKTYYRTGDGLGPLWELHNLESLELNIRSFCDPVAMATGGTIDNVDETSLFEFLPSSLKSLDIFVGYKGLSRMHLCLLRFCGATEHQPLRSAALA